VRLPSDANLLKVAVIRRGWKDGRFPVGFVEGLGFKLGAVASSFSVSLNHVVVVGSSDSDMALAVSRLEKLGGGVVVVNGGRVVEELPLPLGGLMSPESSGWLARKLKAIKRLLWKAGAPFENPLNPIQFLTFTYLPWIRITDKGLVDVKNRRIISLLPGEGEGAAA
ncbi:hypothetical protein DRO53_03580, partial [Candidatus Bathyarchaeota archaeon]